MGNIWVREFTGGLDTRRMKETTAGGVLVRANNGHISRGGEFEKRAAFVPTFALPAGTVGLVAGQSSLYVFGHAEAPAGLPIGILYQRLQHSTPGIALTQILSAELYAGKLYVVGLFADGAVFHFYDGARVTDWYDGRARATFSVTGGSVTPSQRATGSFEVTGGSAPPAVPADPPAPPNQITAVMIDGVNLINVVITHNGNNNTTASAIAAAINSFVSTPDYTATASGPVVIIQAVAGGAAPNGKAISRIVTGDFTTGNAVAMSGGVTATASTLTSLTINGVPAIGGPVAWTTDAVQMAQDITAAIVAHASNPEYVATTDGPNVNIVAAVAGAAANGRSVVFTTSGGLTLTPSSGLVLADGSDATVTYQPGTFVKTIGKKVYSTSGPNMHFSGIAAPTKWTTDTTGAGFIDMSSEAAGSEELTALAKYQNQIAVFAERIVQVWYIDPDPALNRQSQVLNNTGTISPKSVTQFGDNDIFYLDESGLRSLRARDSSNAAATTDIGVPIDSLVVEKLSTIDLTERQKIVSAIEPRDGRFWLAIKDLIFVFSFFNGAKVSAWSTYTPSTIQNGQEVSFDVEEMTVFRRRVYLRSGNTVYAYGGVGNTPQYDATMAEAWLPYLDANDPSRSKNFTGVDAALEGQWSVAVAFQPTDEDAEDDVATFTKTTFNDWSTPGLGDATHISLRFRSKGIGPAKVSSAVIHYEGDQIADK